MKRLSMMMRTMLAGVLTFAAVGAATNNTAEATGEVTATAISAASRCQDIVFIGVAGSGATQDFDDMSRQVFSTFKTRLAAKVPRNVRLGYVGLDYPAVNAMTAIFPNTRADEFYPSIDAGVTALRSLLASRSRCVNERYVLQGYSQGAMVLHRAAFQLHQDGLLSRVSAVVAIADGDRNKAQGSNNYGTANNLTGGLIWNVINPLDDGGGSYNPTNGALPTEIRKSWNSVCMGDDLICNPNPILVPLFTAPALWLSLATEVTREFTIHTDAYKTGGQGANDVTRAAQKAADAAAARVPKATDVPTVPQIAVPTAKMRVGDWGTIALDPRDPYAELVESSGLESLPGATVWGGYTLPTTLAWSPSSPGTYPYRIYVLFSDGAEFEYTGTVEAIAVPNPSLALINPSASFVASSPDYYSEHWKVSFDIVKTTASDTTPSQDLTDTEDPASTGYRYQSGDTNADGRLDLGESWHYQGTTTWYENWPKFQTTVRLYANDLTGAQGFLEPAPAPIPLPQP